MTRVAKLFAHLVAYPGAERSFRDFERVVLAIGYVLQRTTGSHRHYRHPKVPTVLTLSPKNGNAAIYQVRDFVAICEEHCLSVDE